MVTDYQGIISPGNGVIPLCHDVASESDIVDCINRNSVLFNVEVSGTGFEVLGSVITIFLRVEVRNK